MPFGVSMLFSFKSSFCNYSLICALWESRETAQHAPCVFGGGSVISLSFRVRRGILMMGCFDSTAYPLFTPPLSGENNVQHDG